MKKVKKITLKDWVKSGEGGNAESFCNVNDDTIMLKLSKTKGRCLREMEDEIRINRLVEKLGINIPKMYDEVVCGKRKGIIFKRLRDKKSIAALCHENPKKIEYYAKVYAREAYVFHSKRCKVKGIPSIKETLIQKFNAARKEDKVVIELIRILKENLSDVNNCVHGDMTLGNLVMSEKKFYWIDMGKFSYGDPFVDLSKIYFSYKVLSKLYFVRKIFHLNKKQLNLFCDTFFKEYSKLSKIKYNELVEKTEKLTVIWYHHIWVNSTAAKILRDFVRYKAKRYQKMIEESKKR